MHTLTLIWTVSCCRTNNSLFIFQWQTSWEQIQAWRAKQRYIIWACRSRALQINRHSHPLHCQSALDKFKVCVPVHPIVALVPFKQITEFVHVHVMEGIEFLGRWFLIPLHWNWLPNWGEVANWRTTHSESVSFLMLQYVWCFGGLLLSRCCCVTQLQWSIHRYTVHSLQLQPAAHCTANLFTHLLYRWVFYKAWDQRSTGKCHVHGREAGRYPWFSAAVPVSTEAKFLLSFPLD